MSRAFERGRRASSSVRLEADTIALSHRLPSSRPGNATKPPRAYPCGLCSLWWRLRAGLEGAGIAAGSRRSVWSRWPAGGSVTPLLLVVGRRNHEVQHKGDKLRAGALSLAAEAATGLAPSLPTIRKRGCCGWVTAVAQVAAPTLVRWMAVECPSTPSGTCCA